MARTKASVGAKVSSGKSSKARCSVAPPPSTSLSSGSGSGERVSRSQGGGNPVCLQPTPKWQRPITNFFIGKPPSNYGSDNENDISASSSKSKKRNVIESDEEEAPPTADGRVCKALEDTIELKSQNNSKNAEGSDNEENYIPNNENLIQNGEYPNNINKGKGKGKKTNKENVSNNTEEGKRKSTKRDLDSSVEGHSDRVSKIVKVN